MYFRHHQAYSVHIMIDDLGMGHRQRVKSTLTIIIIIIIKDICIAQVRKGHKCAMSAEMVVWLHNSLCL